MNKEKKKINEIKIDIKDTLIKGKVYTRVFEFQSINEMYEIIDKIDPNIRLKLLINYITNKFYLFKTESSKKKILLSGIKELKAQEIASLFKSFYSEKKLEWNNSLLSKTKKMKYEISPTTFDVEDNYLVSDNRYINTISIEHLGKYLNFKNVLGNNEYWLSIDLYKVDNKYILNKLNEMKKHNVLEKKFTDFIINKLGDIINKLKEETVFQCEIKLLLYNNNLDYINKQSEIIRKTLCDNYCTSYIPQERLNTRKLFEKCIYPNLKMDIIHSIADKQLFKMISGDSNV